MSNSETLDLKPQVKLTLASDEFSSGHIVEIGSDGKPVSGTFITVPASSSIQIGANSTYKRYRLVSNAGRITYTRGDEAFTTPGETLASPSLTGNLTGDAFLDEDDMVSDSATKAASQQSIKAFVTAQIAAASVGSEFIQHQTADSDASITFSDLGDSTHAAYRVVGVGLQPDALASLYVRINGSDSADYDHHTTYGSLSSGTVNEIGSAGDTKFVTQGNWGPAAAKRGTVEMLISNPQTAAHPITIFLQATYIQNDNVSYYSKIIGLYDAAELLSSIEIKFNGTNISGELTCTAIKNS